MDAVLEPYKVEETELSEDEDTLQGFVRGLRQRYADLENERRGKHNELMALEANPPRQDHDIDLLDRLPQLRARLHELPDDLQRRLYDAFGLEIHVHPDRRQALIRITLSSDTIDDLAAATQHATAQTTPTAAGSSERRPAPGETGASVVDAVRAPCGVSTASTTAPPPGPRGRLVVEAHADLE